MNVRQRGKALTLSRLMIVEELARMHHEHGMVGREYLRFLETLNASIGEEGRLMPDLLPDDVDLIKRTLCPCWKNDSPPARIDDLLEAAGRVYEELFGGDEECL